MVEGGDIPGKGIIVRWSIKLFRHLTKDALHRKFYILLRSIKRKLGIPIDKDVTYIYRGERGQVAIIDGNGEREYSRDELVVSLEPRPELPPELEQNLKEVRHNPKILDPSGKKSIWNGPIVNLIDYKPLRTIDERYLAAGVQMFHSEYFLFQLTVRRLQKEYAEFLKTGHYPPDGLMRKHIMSRSLPDEERLRTPVPALASGVGVVCTVLTSDLHIVGGWRSRRLGSSGDEFTLGFAENINPDIDLLPNKRLNPWRTAQRAVIEELATDVEERDIKILGFGVDTTKHLFNFLGFVRTKDTSSEILRKRSLGAAGKWEFEEISFTPIERNRLDQKIKDSKRLGFSVLSLHFALVNMGHAKLANELAAA